MIRVKDIWGDIEKEGLVEYVSKYEIWFKKKEIKEFLKNKRILLKDTGMLVYFIIILYFLAIVAGFIYLYQGITEGIGHRALFGVAVILLGSIALYIWSSNRYSVVIFILKDGIVAGIKEKRIKKLFKYEFSFLPYSAISDIRVKKASSELRVLEIQTIDGKLWRNNKRHYSGIMLNRKEVPKYLEIIYGQLEKNKKE